MSHVIDFRTKKPLESLPYTRDGAARLMEYLFEYRRGDDTISQEELSMVMDMIDYLEVNSGVNTSRLDDLEEYFDFPPEGA